MADASQAQGGGFGRRFWLALALLMAGVVVYGFGHSVRKVLHPPFPLPPVLFVHIAAFSLWTALVVAQSALIQAGRPGLHRRLGWAGVGLGATLPILGVWASLAMLRLERIAQPSAAALIDGQLLSVLWEIAEFTGFFVLAVLARRRLDIHRRAMLMATLILAATAFTRFPSRLHMDQSGVYLILALCLGADLIQRRQVHWVFALAFAGRLLDDALLRWIGHGQAWRAVAHSLLG